MPAALVSGCLAGVLAGWIYLAVGLVQHGGELVATAPTGSFAIWVLARSVGLYGLLFGGAGLVLGAVVRVVGALLRRPGVPVFATVLGLCTAGIVFLYLSVWWQLEVLAGLPFGDGERLAGAARHGLWGLGAGLVVFLVTVLLGRLGRRGGAPSTPWRAAGASVVLCAVLLGVSQVALRPGAATVDGTYRPSQVVIVGMDALSFRIMGPMLRTGELPTFRRLIEEGAWGSFLTYGEASSPMVWTSMATGKRVRDHGINDFVTKSDTGYGVQPMKSYDRRARAIWNILGDFGLRVGVIDWLITYPPEEVNGYVVSRLHFDESHRTYPPELNADIDALLDQVTDYGDEHRTKNFSEIDHVFATADLLLDREPLDFLAMFEGVSDWVEHRYWKYYQPDRFTPELWSHAPGEVEQLGSIIPETYAHLDRRLGELMQRLDDDALLIVVSDHGQQAVAGRQVWMRFDRILEALGYAELGGDGEQTKVDYGRSRAYAATETPWAPLIGVNLNLQGREPEGIVDPAVAGSLTAEVIAAIRDVRFEDGTPLFGAVYAAGGGGSGDTVAGQSDIVVTHSRHTRSDRDSQRAILVGGRRFKLDDFMEADVKISGGHDHQGVIFMHGRCVRPGPIGQQVVTTALQEVIWHVTDKIDAVDPWLPVLGRLGLIERATTLDVTPTTLHALGLPVAEDMAGKALAKLLVTGEAPTTIASYETDEGGNLRAGEVESDEDMMERLKALGYIN